MEADPKEWMQDGCLAGSSSSSLRMELDRLLLLFALGQADLLDLLLIQFNLIQRCPPSMSIITIIITSLEQFSSLLFSIRYSILRENDL